MTPRHKSGGVRKGFSVARKVIAMESVNVASSSFDDLIGREWLIANGLGGYASSTLCGMNTRKYHGLLVAAMSPPVRRMVILSRIDERVHADGHVVELACNEYPGTIHPRGDQFLRAFNGQPFPRWAYQNGVFTLEKSVRLLPGENAVCVTYTLLAGDKKVCLELRPMLALRPIHELMYQWNGRLRAEQKDNEQVEIPATSRTPEVFFAHDGEFDDSPVWYLSTIYRREQERGYAGLEDLWMPGVFRRALSPGQTLHLVCSMEKVDLGRIVSETRRAHESAPNPLRTNDPVFADLSRSTSAYIVNVVADRPAAVVTHYPWSAPSFRGALISLAGLMLIPDRFDQARSLLDSAAGLADHGVIPSQLPEDGTAPLYHGADVSLWFINAVHQFGNYTSDETSLRRWLTTIDSIIDNYRNGTLLGIAADADGLISSRADDQPTTWMDAKLIDSVITPRQGRPVEINALWFNALRIAAELHRRFDQTARADELTALADNVAKAFNRRFWNHHLNCLYDVVDDTGADPSVRPNQIFALSLPFPVLQPNRREAVLETVLGDLLTPMGVRTLSPRHPAYQGRYAGNVISRDRAYQQGSAYPWLLGPLVTALLKTRGRTDQTLRQGREILQPVLQHLRGPGLGLINELFDGDAPHRPGGAIASAPAVAELLRAWSEDILGIIPASGSSTAELPSTAGLAASN
jgi:predicted glycogen debranching enzyme